MQTFMPYPSFERSAQALDWKRLGKQRLEAKSILKVLAGETRGWVHHPAVLMWRGYEAALRCYHDAVVREWVRRGYRNTMPLLATEEDRSAPLPPWFGDEAFHSSHRQTLLFKNPEHYGRLGWSETAKYEYVWPVIR